MNINKDKSRHEANHLIGFYDYTVILTYLSLISSVVGFYEAHQENTLGAVVCLLFSGLFDMFDGRVARTKKNRTEEEKLFGIQIDSLTDMCAFCALPVAIAFSNGLYTIRGVVACSLYALCGMIRLAYFNVKEEERQSETDEARKEYLGLPVTSIAISMPVVYAIGRRLAEQNTLQILLEAILFISAFAFITPIRVEKPHGKGIIGLVLTGLAILVFGILLW